MANPQQTGAKPRIVGTLTFRCFWGINVLYQQAVRLPYDTYLEYMQTSISELIRMLREHPAQSLAFVAVSGVILLMTYAFLYVVGLTPEPIPKESNTPVTAVTSNQATGGAAQATLGESVPGRIIIDAIGVNAPINNPLSRKLEVLDESLLSGVVHYPGSGDLEDTSNLFLFGHSSYLPVVNNEMFRVFNNLNKLSAGDVIRVFSEGFEYRYEVTEVLLVDAEEALVELSNREKKLTLSTCNSFGDPGERFVVEADFLGRVPLGG